MIKAISCILGLLIFTGCGYLDAKPSTDVSIACGLVGSTTNERLRILISLEMNRDNLEKVSRREVGPFLYIDSEIRKSIFADIPDTEKAIEIRERFAIALDTFVAAKLQELDDVKGNASTNLENVASEIRRECESLGYWYDKSSQE